MKIRIALLALIIAMVGCSEDVMTGPIGIAVVAPQSGPNNAIGAEIKSTLELVLDGLPNREVAGRRIEPVYVDSQSDPAAAVSAYNAAIDDPENNIHMGFFNWHSDVALELMEVAADRRMAHFAALGATQAINEKVAGDPARYNVWSKGWPTPQKLFANYVTALEDAITDGTFTPSSKTVAIYAEDTNWGADVASALKSSLEENGWTVAIDIKVAQDGIDFTSEIDMIKATNPTLIAGTIASSSAATFISQVNSAFEDAAEKPVILADGLGWNADWYDTLGAGSNFVVDQIPQFATAEAQKFSSDFEAATGAPPSPSAGGLAFDYFNMLITILERAQADHMDITQENILKVHSELVLTGQLTKTDGILMNKYQWDADSGPDPVVGGDAFTFPVLQYKDGESVVVWPASLSAGDKLTGPTAE